MEGINFALFLLSLVTVVVGRPQFIVPTGAQSWNSPTVPVAGQAVFATQPQAQIIQIIRQPNGVLTGVVGQPAMASSLESLGSVMVPPATTSTLGLDTLSLSGLGLGASGIPAYSFPVTSGYTAANVNGVPMLISGLGVTGHQSLGYPVTSAATINRPIIQPVISSIGHVIRQAEAEPPEEVDPMDAALLDMEKKGQMHMEKYAWGRSAANLESKVNTEYKDQRAELPVFYAALPPGTLNQAPLAFSASAKPARNVNQFMDKRNKHFELYQYQ